MTPNDADVLCPYYKRKDRSRIICEGLLDCTTFSVNFGHPSDCSHWRKVYCSERWIFCPLSKAISADYEKRIL